MKRYKKYMDGVKAPDTLHRRLAGLKGTEKRPVPWAKYGTMAAALALVCGLGGYGAWAARTNSRNAPMPPYPAGYQDVRPELGAAGQPDIAPVEPGEMAEPGEKAIGGCYEVISGSGENAVSSYYILPHIVYGVVAGETQAAQTAADWDVPRAIKRDMDRDDIAMLLGGEDALSVHLDWDSYDLSGWAAWREDGAFWGACVMGYAGPLDHFEFMVTAGCLPPTCIRLSGSVEQEVNGVTVTADGYDSTAAQGGGAYASCRRVSFMKDGYGYRFDLTGTSRALAVERVSRLVRLIADQGVEVDQLTSDGAPGQGAPSGYVPNELTDPGGSAPAAYACEICGRSIPVGMEHSHELCGYPLAPEES